MANPYKLTVLFNDKEIAAGQHIHLKLEITINTTGQDEEVSAEEEGIKVIDYGTVQIDYNFRDFLLAPSSYTIKFFDEYKFLHDYTFGGNFVDKRFYIELLIHDSDESEVLKFTGYVVEKSQNWDEYKKTLGFKFAPKMDLLTKTLVFDDSNIKLFPLHSIDTIYENENSVVTITKLITDIYKFINPNITVQFYHDWIFEGQHKTEYKFLKNIPFSEVSIMTKYFFHEPKNNIKSLSDILKTLTKMFCSFTGVINNDVAFFSKVYRNNALSSQAIVSDDIISLKKRYDSNLIEYVKTTYRPKPGESAYYDFTSGNELLIEGKYLFVDVWLYLLESYNAHAPGALNYETNLLDSTGNYWISCCKDPTINYTDTYDPFIDNYNHIGQVICDYWYLFRSDSENNIITALSLNGLKFPMTINYLFSGNIYPPFKVTYDIIKNKTDLELLTIEGN